MIYDVPNYTTGIDSAITGTIGQINGFAPMFLFFVFAVIFISGMTSQKRRSGFSDMPMWATLSGIATSMIALAMSLAQNMITTTTLVVVIVITIVSGLWLFLSRNKNEV